MKSPQVTQFINLKTTGVQQTQGQFDRLSASLNRYSQNLNKSTTATKKQNQQLGYFSDQGLANIQTGLLQVTTFAMNMNQKLNNIFEKMTNRFGTAEQAVTQLKISMGLIGERTSANEHLFRDFDRMIKVVDRLAGTTKFTKVEVTNALNSLIKGGLEASQAIGLLDPMIKFVSASAGQIDLETGAEIARKTYSTLGGELATVEDNLNRLFKATQKTPLGMDELNEFLTGIRDASKKFGETDKMEANILALGAAIRSTGISGREAGGLINQFAKGAMDMVAQLDKSRIRKGQRVNVKREYILELLGISKRQMSESQIRAIMKDRQTEINRLRDKYAEQMFVETRGGDKVLKDPEKFIKTIMDNYSRLLNDPNFGTQGAKTVLGKAFGKAVGPQFVNAINNIVEQNKQRGIKNYGELVKMLDEHNNEITTAHKLSLDDLKSRAAVLESSYDALFQSIMEHDVYGKESLETHSTVITAIKDLVKGNSSLAVSMSAIGRTAQIATSVITNLGFALVAAATFAIGAKYAGLGAAGSMVSLSSVVGAFHKTFLAPTLRVLLLFGGGLTTAGLFAVAFARSLSESGTVAGGFRDTLISVKKQVQSLVALFKLSTDKKFGSETLSKLVTRYKDLRESMRNLHLVRFNAEVKGNAEVLQRSQEELNKLNAEYREFQKVAGVENLQAFMELDPEKQSGVVKLMETLKLTFNAISSLVNGMLIPISSTLGYVVDSFISIAKIIFTPIQAILNMFGFFSDETGESFALKALGILIGSFMSLKVIIGSVTMVIGTLTGFVTGAITRHANLSNTIKMLSRDFRELSMVKVMSQRLSGPTLHTTNRIKEISIIDKLVLSYLKLTGQTQRYQAVVDTLNGANIRLTNTSARTNDTLGMVNQKLKMNSAVLTNAANSMSRYNSLMGTGRDRAMMFGNALLMVSGFITMFASDTGSAGHLFSNFISIVTMGIFALQAVLTLFGTTITTLFMSNPILFGLLGLTGLVGSFFLAKHNVDKAVKRQTFGADTKPPESYGSTKAYASNSMLSYARPQSITNNNTFNYNDNSNITTTDANLENTITARQKNINFFKLRIGNESISVDG